MKNDEKQKGRKAKSISQKREREEKIFKITNFFFFFFFFDDDFDFDGRDDVWSGKKSYDDDDDDDDDEVAVVFVIFFVFGNTVRVVLVGRRRSR